MILKVCGMRDAENIQQLEDINDVDWIGFIFVPGSKRFALENPNFTASSSKKKVGVFVDATVEEIRHAALKYDLDLIQLHGFENVDFIRKLKSNLNTDTSKPIFIIKVFSIDLEFDFSSIYAFESVSDYFLFDTKGKDAGGNGIQFDWNLLKHYEGTVPFLLAGGISLDSFDEIKKFKHKQWIGIDVNSAFEDAPGKKNVAMVEVFTEKLRHLKGPAHIVRKFVKYFNNGNVNDLAELYHDDAINHQVANEPLDGKEAIKSMFQYEFKRAEMICLVENIFEIDSWAILEWKDPKGLRGCGFFNISNGQIKFQRGYWDKLSFYKIQNLPIVDVNGKIVLD